MTRVVTLTMNPALDVSTATQQVEPTHKLRCGAAIRHPGGGGINVARVVARLGTEVLALYPAGGVTGQILGELLDAEQVPGETVPITAETRENFSVHERRSGQDYRFVLPGPELTETEWQACLDRAVALATATRFFVASGSLPPGVPVDFYARLARRLAVPGVRLVLDTSGAALAEALRQGVYLVKPSLRELEELCGRPLPEPAEQLEGCRQIVRAGQAQVVALSLGAHGALLVNADGAWRAPALAVQVASTIGAGDSFVGGLVRALSVGESIESALRHAMAASAAALLSQGTALCDRDDVARLLPQVVVRAA